MRISVGGSESDAVLHALAEAHGKGVEIGEGDGVFVVVQHVRHSGAEAPRRVDNVETRALGAVVADVEDDAEREGPLDVEVPDLHVRQAVVLVHRVVAFSLRHGGEAVSEGEGRRAGRGVAVGLHVGPGRLEGEVLHELYVLAVGEVDAVAGADDGVLDGAPCDADARGEVGLLRARQGCAGRSRNRARRCWAERLWLG